MKKTLFIIFIFSFRLTQAQQFISNGSIEYEVRVNNYNVLGNDAWGQMIREKVPRFSVSWYNLTFNNDKAIYKFNRLDEKTKAPSFIRESPEDNIWFNDYTAGIFTDQKNIFGENYILKDSLMNLSWKMVPNETREIAGFNCRKAQAIIFDSVYVFAFYTDEINVSGGPMGFHGLPGMILGITIPRMYTSWIADKIIINGVNTSVVVAPAKGKIKKASELQDAVKKVSSDWGSSYAQQIMWRLFL
jgi:GLPGLI family protein